MLTSRGKGVKKGVKRYVGQKVKDSSSSSTSTSRIQQSKSTASAPTAVDIRGVQVHFPFKPYKCQEAYMGKVLDALNCSENALLESPTGTGKTLCLLCSTLAWQQEQKRLLSDPLHAPAVAAAGDSNVTSTASSQEPTLSKVPTIIYASRTHSQLSQVVKELRFTRYRPKHAVLGSREQMCVHPKVRTANATSADINHNCSRLNKERKCKYRNGLDGFVVQSGNGTGEAFGMQPVLDMEELIVLGTKRKVCPFYLTRGQIPDAEVIFVPYNYLFDKDARGSTLADVQWENSIIIFDEAHNLESFASESASFDLSAVDIGGCVNEIQRAIGYLQAMPEIGEGSVKMENLIRLKSIFLQFETYLDSKITVGANGGSFAGEMIFDIFAKGANLTHKNHVIFLQFVRQVTDMIMEIRGGSTGGATSTSSGTPKLDHFVGCVKRVFGSSAEGQAIAKARAYRVHISAKTNNGPSGRTSTGGGGFVGGRGNAGKESGRVLSYWCFAPSLAMNELAALNVRSILVTSGTLSPLPSYSLELGLPFPHTLENAHIIGSDQISVRVVGKGVSGKSLTSTYKRRNDADYIIELGNTIISLGKVIPGCVLIFFPSYGLMGQCVEKWGGPISSRSRNTNFGKDNFFQARQKKAQSPATGSARYCFPHAAVKMNQAAGATPWQRLNAVKSIVLEPKTTAELKEVIAEFEKYNDAPKSKGTFLMGVCRGKISEGIDFADDKCRAVIITGIPFAPYMDPKVKLKREYLDGVKASLASKPSEDGGFGTSKSATATRPVSLSGEEWYSQQAHRAVNQAIGRVIRHRADYGAILFLDSRYSAERNQLGVSKWIRSSFTADEGMGGTIRSLVKFFRGAKEKADANKARLESSLNNGIMLKYENEVNKKSQSTDPDTALDSAEDITKVAFVKKAENISGYVPPNQIIKQVKLNEVSDRRKIKKKSESIQLKSVSSKTSGLAALYKVKNQRSLGKVRSHENNDIAGTIRSAWSGLQLGQDKKGSTLQSSSRVKESSGKDSKILAQQFFVIAKQTLSPVDFISIRKLLVCMKESGDKKDIKAYTKTAKALVTILLKYDDPLKGIKLLELLHFLLPVVYRYRIEIMTCGMRFETSDLKSRCLEACFSPKDIEILERLYPILMLDYDKWKDDGNYPFSKTSLLNNLHKLIGLMDRYKMLEKETCIPTLSLLLPKSLHNPVRTMANEIRSKNKMKLLKVKDMTRFGEEGIKKKLFERPSGDFGIAKKQQEEQTEEDVLAMRAALHHAASIKKEAAESITRKIAESRKERKVQNPYAKKTASEPSALAAPNISRPSKRARSMLDTTKTPSKSLSNAKIQNQTPHGLDPLERYLEQAKAEIYRKATPKIIRINRRLQSNAPEGTICNICSKKATSFFMAECNHFSCLDCWVDWLKRSQTCPTCRQKTNKNCLSRVVFETEAGAGAPSLTQMCESDDELEIVR